MDNLYNGQIYIIDRIEVSKNCLKKKLLKLILQVYIYSI